MLRLSSVFALMGVLAGACTGTPAPQVRQIQFLPYLASDGGKFVEIALDRPLAKEEGYRYRLAIRIRTGRSINCDGDLANDKIAAALGDAPLASTFRQNLFINFGLRPRERSPAFAYGWETIDVHIVPGAIESVPFSDPSSSAARTSVSLTPRNSAALEELNSSERVAGAAICWLSC